MPFPSSVRFCSILTYDSKRRNGDADRIKAASNVDAIKRDGFVGGRRIIPYVAERIVELRQEFPFISEFLNKSTILVPVPSSSPRVAGGLWVPFNICDSLVKHGLGEAVCPCLIRHTPVVKSAYSPRGARANAIDHVNTMSVDTKQTLLYGNATSITLVDDVVTRGETFIGSYVKVKESFPNARIQCFAYVSARGLDNFTKLLDPVEGTISYQFDAARRDP